MKPRSKPYLLSAFTLLMGVVGLPQKKASGQCHAPFYNPPFADGTLIENPKGIIMLIQGGYRRGIPDLHTLASLGFGGIGAKCVTEEVVQSIPVAADFPHIETPFLTNTPGTIFRLQLGESRGFPDQNTLLCQADANKWNLSANTHNADAILAVIRRGPAYSKATCCGHGQVCVNNGDKLEHARTYTLIDNRNEPLFIFYGVYNAAGPSGVIDCQALQSAGTINRGGQWSLTIQPGTWGEIRLHTTSDKCDGNHMRWSSGPAPLKPAVGSEPKSGVLQIN